MLPPTSPRPLAGWLPRPGPSGSAVLLTCTCAASMPYFARAVASSAPAPRPKSSVGATALQGSPRFQQQFDVATDQHSIAIQRLLLRCMIVGLSARLLAASEIDDHPILAPRVRASRQSTRWPFDLPVCDRGVRAQIRRMPNAPQMEWNRLAGRSESAYSDRNSLVKTCWPVRCVDHP